MEITVEIIENLEMERDRKRAEARATETLLGEYKERYIRSNLKIIRNGVYEIQYSDGNVIAMLSELSEGIMYFRDINADGSLYWNNRKVKYDYVQHVSYTGKTYDLEVSEKKESEETILITSLLKQNEKNAPKSTKISINKFVAMLEEAKTDGNKGNITRIQGNLEYFVNIYGFKSFSFIWALGKGGIMKKLSLGNKSYKLLQEICAKKCIDFPQ